MNLNPNPSEITEEVLAANVAISMNMFLSHIQLQGIDAVLAPIKMAVNTTIQTEKQAKDFLVMLEGNLWNPKDSEEEQVKKLENSTVSSMAHLTASIESLTKIFGSLDFVLFNKLVTEQLQKLNFDFDLYDTYVQAMKEIILNIKQEYGIPENFDYNEHMTLEG